MIYIWFFSIRFYVRFFFFYVCRKTSDIFSWCEAVRAHWMIDSCGFVSGRLSLRTISLRCVHFCGATPNAVHDTPFTLPRSSLAWMNEWEWVVACSRLCSQFICLESRWYYTAITDVASVWPQRAHTFVDRRSQQQQQQKHHFPFTHMYDVESLRNGKKRKREWYFLCL